MVWNRCQPLTERNPPMKAEVNSAGSSSPLPSVSALKKRCFTRDRMSRFAASPPPPPPAAAPWRFHGQRRDGFAWGWGCPELRLPELLPPLELGLCGCQLRCLCRRLCMECNGSCRVGVGWEGAKVCIWNRGMCLDRFSKWVQMSHSSWRCRVGGARLGGRGETQIIEN